MMIKAPGSKDVLSGLLFLAAGVLSGALSLGLPIGDRIRMGAGYVPLALSIILSGLGLLVLVRAVLRGGAPVTGWHARPVFFVVASALVFGLTIERTGLRSVSLSHRADRRRRVARMAPSRSIWPCRGLIHLLFAAVRDPAQTPDQALA